MLTFSSLFMLSYCMVSDDAKIGGMVKIWKDEVVRRMILVNWVNGI